MLCYESSSYFNEQPGSGGCTFSYNEKEMKRGSQHALHKPGFGVGFGGAGRVGTALIIYVYGEFVL